MSRPTRVLLPLLLLSLEGGCHAADPSLAPAARAESPAREGYVDAGGGVRLFYRALGSGGDTVVVVHGGPGFTMDYFLEDLAPLSENHTLLFYDQRGTGRSSLVRDSAGLDGQRFAEDLEAIRSHFGLERLTILGHSWGAGLVALYAARHPERLGRLLIVGGIPLERGQLTRAFQQLAAGRDSTTRRQMQARAAAWRADPENASACRAFYVLWFRPFFADPAVMSRSKGDFCAGTPESLRNGMESVERFTMASLGEWDWQPALRQVTAPTLVIHGTRDPLPLEGARGWAATLPNSRLLLLEGIGHFPYLEVPELFFDAVDAFLRGRWPEGAKAVGAP
jgi:proline iminopeptidase